MRAIIILITLVLTLYIVLAHTSLIFMLLTVRGRSMLPTFVEGERLISVRAYLCKLKVGDVVVAKPYKNDDRMVIKRIARIHNNTYYILGDNPDDSYDSRNYGWVSNKQIVAKVVIRKS